MLRLGRHRALDGLTRLGAEPLICKSPLQSLTCLSALAPVQSQVARTFASQDKYDPSGDMSAVTFHGPRTMKVSRKPKPRIQEPGVSTSSWMSGSNRC